MPIYRGSLQTCVHLFHGGVYSQVTNNCASLAGQPLGSRVGHPAVHKTQPSRWFGELVYLVNVLTSYHYDWFNIPIGGVVPDETAKKIAQGDHRYMPEV